MTKPLGFLAAVLLLAGCNWSQGWHWPRVPPRIYQGQTVVYFDVGHLTRSDHRAIADWARYQWTRSPVVAIRLVNACSTNSNCVHWRTSNLPYPINGRTAISIGSNNHLIAATVNVDTDLNNADPVYVRRETGCVEAMLALGGGWDDPATSFDEHSIGCNGRGYPTAHDYEEIARVYNHSG